MRKFEIVCGRSCNFIDFSWKGIPNGSSFLSQLSFSLPPTLGSITFLFDWKLSTPEKKSKKKRRKAQKDEGKIKKVSFSIFAADVE